MNSIHRFAGKMVVSGLVLLGTVAAQAGETRVTSTFHNATCTTYIIQDGNVTHGEAGYGTLIYAKDEGSISGEQVIYYSQSSQTHGTAQADTQREAARLADQSTCSNMIYKTCSMEGVKLYCVQTDSTSNHQDDDNDVP